MLNTAIQNLQQDQDKIYKKLYNNLELLGDIRQVYNLADTTAKQELIRLVFDNNLYYENGMYRTPTMIEELSHNALIMEEKGLLVYKKKRENFAIPPLSGLDGTFDHFTNLQMSLLYFTQHINY